MASRSTRPTYKDPSVEQAWRIAEATVAQRQQQAQMADLSSQGYDPAEVGAWSRGGGKLSTLMPKPKTTAGQALDALKREAAEARARRTINPVSHRDYTDPVSGQVFDRQTDRNTSRTDMIPQQLEDGNARYQPKLGAWKGVDEAGASWAMDRNNYGAADPESYRITKTAKAAKEPKIKYDTGPDGKRRGFIDAPNDQGGITRNFMPITDASDNNSVINFDKKQEWTHPEGDVTWKAKLDSNTGEWNPDTAQPSLTPKAKNVARNLLKQRTSAQSAYDKAQSAYDKAQAKHETYAADPEFAAQATEWGKKAEDAGRALQHYSDAHKAFSAKIRDTHGDDIARQVPGYDLPDDELTQSDAGPDDELTQEGVPSMQAPADKFSEAEAWLQANPDDPRAAKIAEKLRRQRGN